MARPALGVMLLLVGCAACGDDEQRGRASDADAEVAPADGTQDVDAPDGDDDGHEAVDAVDAAEVVDGAETAETGVADVAPDAAEDVADTVEVDTTPLPPVPAGVTRFGGTTLDQPDDDLAPFAAMIEGADLVGLGESLHTSGGFYALKRRLVKWLVETQGFRVLAIESPRSNAEITARYVERCVGTSRQAASGVFGVFADDNFQRMLEDLCDYNRAHPDDPVRFFGFDVQQPADDRDALHEFLGERLPDEVDALLAPIDMHCHMGDGPLEVRTADYTPCLAALDLVDARFVEHRDAWVEALGEDVVDIAALSSLGIRSWQDEARFFNLDASRSYQARDTAMATVFETMRRWRYPGRTILWAHDYHLQRQSIEDAWQPVCDVMGSYLARTFGDAYRAFAISAIRVGANWPSDDGIDANDCGYGYTPEEGSFERDVGEAYGVGDYLFDLPVAAAAPDALAPADVPVTYGIYGDVALPRQFRGAFVLAESPPMRAVFWPACPD